MGPGFRRDDGLWAKRASACNMPQPGGFRLLLFRTLRLVEQARPIAFDTFQMGVHQSHGLDRIAPGDRLEDADMLVVRLPAAFRTLEINAPALGGHQIEDAHDAIEDVVLRGVDDLEMEVAILDVDRLTRLHAAQ